MIHCRAENDANLWSKQIILIACEQLFVVADRFRWQIHIVIARSRNNDQPATSIANAVLMLWNPRIYRCQSAGHEVKKNKYICIWFNNVIDLHWDLHLAWYFLFRVETEKKYRSVRQKQEQLREQVEIQIQIVDLRRPQFMCVDSQSIRQK